MGSTQRRNCGICSRIANLFSGRMRKRRSNRRSGDGCCHFVRRCVRIGQVCRKKFKSRLIQAATLSEEGRSEVLLESSNERRRASRTNCLTY